MIPSIPSPCSSPVPPTLRQTVPDVGCEWTLVDKESDGDSQSSSLADTSGAIKCPPSLPFSSLLSHLLPRPIHACQLVSHYGPGSYSKAAVKSEDKSSRCTGIVLTAKPRGEGKNMKADQEIH